MMSQYTNIDEWEWAWKLTPTMREFIYDYRGRLRQVAGTWYATRTEPLGDMEVCGSGDTPVAAIQDWWENRLNALAPEWLQGQKAALMMRSTGDPQFQNMIIKGYDDV